MASSLRDSSMVSKPDSLGPQDNKVVLKGSSVVQGLVVPQGSKVSLGDRLRDSLAALLRGNLAARLRDNLVVGKGSSVVEGVILLCSKA